jgi:hypothetical protein
MIKRQFLYPTVNEKITAIALDSTNNRLWIAFEQDTDGICLLRCVSAFNPSQTYYDLEVEVDQINKLIISGTSIYAVIEDSLILARKYVLLSPLSTYTDFTIPSGITEAPIDAIVDGTNILFLTPGLLSGTNAKLVEFTTAGVYSETVDLTVANAKGCTIDTVTDIWVVTGNSPSELVRVYDSGGWNITVNTLTI